MADFMRGRTITSKLLLSYRSSSGGMRISTSQNGERSRIGWPICTTRNAGIVCAATAIGLYGFPILGIGVAVFVWILSGYSRIRTDRLRRDAMERDLPALLNAVASSVRAGIDPLRALHDAVDYLPPSSALVAELARCVRAIADGTDELEAIENLFAGQSNSDLDLFKRCLLLSRRHGSSLAEPLHRITRVVRQRQSFRRKTRAALAMHRMSALGIALCAVLVAVMQFLVNASGVRTAIDKPAGVALLSTGASLVACGVVWMLLMGREERF